MNRDVDEIEPGSVLRRDVVIIGAGAAGITIARSLSGKKRSVALIEGGSLTPTLASQDLYRGVHKTNAFRGGYSSQYLSTSRQRYFGGGTNCWKGWSVPFNSWDLEKKEYLPHSGWPMTYAELEPWYAPAERELGVDVQRRQDFQDWENQSAGRLLMHTERVKTQLLHRAGTIPRFNKLHREEILASPDVELFLNTNLLEFECTPDRQSIQRIRVSTHEGKVFYIEGRQFVLAAGGIENPRLLLASRRDFAEGLGNRHDQVGRYFMEHIELRDIADLFIGHSGRSFKLYFRRYHEGFDHSTYATLHLSEAVQKEQQLLNSSFYFAKSFTEQDKPVPEFTQVLGRTCSQFDNFKIGEPRQGNPDFFGSLVCRAEQSPHPENRITLVEDRLDALGMPRTHLDWRVRPEDYESIYRSLEVIGREFGRTGIGRIKMTMDPTEPSNLSFGGPHHMGTTRMHENPKQGVVDANCRVHGLSNLYIAGSSVFTTGGFANPTLSIVALALRLSNHLQQKEGAA